MITPFHAVAGNLGHSLEASDAADASELNDAVLQCTGVVPKSLVMFYEHAFGHAQFSQGERRFLAPNAWSTIENRHVFLVDTQTSNRWGFLLGTEFYEQPPVEMLDSSGAWSLASENLPFFLLLVMHYNAANGGLEFGGHATNFSPSEDTFDGWSFAGNDSEMTAYSRRNQAVCFGDGTLFAGATTKRGLRELERDLGVQLRPR